jgi:LmbE family N-acetylglucosaminyl deacetylase
MPGSVVVSPHLDDAAFSASAKLGLGGATVVTVFTAIPDADWPTSWWDLRTGATNSRNRQLERRAEDATAMCLLKAHTIYLDEYELLYRNEWPDLSAATEQLTECFRSADEVWLPAAIGGHPDHRMTRDIGLRAAAQSGQHEVLLYADYPYILTYGWPPSLTGRAPHTHADADFWLTDQFREIGIDPAVLDPELVILDVEQRALKQEIIGTYRSQAQALSLGPADLASDPTKLDYELRWRMAVTSYWESIRPGPPTKNGSIESPGESSTKAKAGSRAAVRRG